jgi:hypothetical protein
MEILPVQESQARAAVTDLRAKAAMEHRRLESLNQLIDDYIGLFPDLATTTTTTPHRPRGQEAVRRVLMASPGVWFSISSMVAELRNRGWLPDSDEPGGAVRASLMRVAAHKDFEKEHHKKVGVVFAYKP